MMMSDDIFDFGIEPMKFDLDSHKHFMIERNSLTKIYYSIYTKTSFGDCITKNDVTKYGENYFDFCKINSRNYYLNKTYGCIPLDFNDIELGKFFLDFGYKFCLNTIVMNRSIDIESNHFMKNNCKSKCDFIYLDVKTQVTKQHSNENIVEMIALKSPHIVYIETLKMDFNQLVYNCGGILALWFGISPVNVSELIKYIPKMLYSMQLLFCLLYFVILFYIKLVLKFLFISLFKFCNFILHILKNIKHLLKQ